MCDIVPAQKYVDMCHVSSCRYNHFETGSFRFSVVSFDICAHTCINPLRPPNDLFQFSVPSACVHRIFTFPLLVGAVQLCSREFHTS